MFCQVASSSVVETTYFGIELNRLAKSAVASSSACSRSGHAAAKPS